MEIGIIKSCKICASTENKFEKNARVCIKCRSKKNNEKLKQANYYKNYYGENKQKFLDNSAKYYEEHTEDKKQKVKARWLLLQPADYVPKPKGRPRKNAEIIV